MLCFAQHDKTDRVIPNASDESSVDASLRCALFGVISRSILETYLTSIIFFVSVNSGVVRR